MFQTLDLLFQQNNCTKLLAKAVKPSPWGYSTSMCWVWGLNLRQLQRGWTESSVCWRKVYMTSSWSRRPGTTKTTGDPTSCIHVIDRVQSSRTLASAFPYATKYGTSGCISSNIFNCYVSLSLASVRSFKRVSFFQEAFSVHRHILYSFKIDKWLQEPDPHAFSVCLHQNWLVESFPSGSTVCPTVTKHQAYSQLLPLDCNGVMILSRLFNVEVWLKVTFLPSDGQSPAKRQCCLQKEFPGSTAPTLWRNSPLREELLLLRLR